MITQVELKAVIHYDPEHGLLTWRAKTGPRVVIGKECGSLDAKGYVVVAIHGKVYKAHRLAWLYWYGEFPQGPLDHIDRDRTNNRIRNLREATLSANAKNQLGPRAANKLGVMGVYKRGDKFRPQICVDNKVINLGSFSTLEEAEQVHLEAKKKYHGIYCGLS